MGNWKNMFSASHHKRWHDETSLHYAVYLSNGECVNKIGYWFRLVYQKIAITVEMHYKPVFKRFCDGSNILKRIFGENVYPSIFHTPLTKKCICTTYYELFKYCNNTKNFTNDNFGIYLQTACTSGYTGQIFHCCSVSTDLKIVNKIFIPSKIFFLTLSHFDQSINPFRSRYFWWASWKFHHHYKQNISAVKSVQWAVLGMSCVLI